MKKVIGSQQRLQKAMISNSSFSQLVLKSEKSFSIKANQSVDIFANELIAHSANNEPMIKQIKETTKKLKQTIQRTVQLKYLLGTYEESLNKCNISAKKMKDTY
ncbi:Hypothetical_protein [Hexamita inflata]|uniref:Hypothetical_protein n=1 Tax=Hexamita inflata TaxID=28002 RepID=A0AA86PV13_9EUKA|nr:Hypothetical protein HINF_LOCUS34101 [Hexamita inflata]CAI9973210.1 Hypothetical protein HINF_LOCUS60855 [Hexamita inflata]